MAPSSAPPQRSRGHRRGRQSISAQAAAAGANDAGHSGFLRDAVRGALSSLHSGPSMTLATNGLVGNRDGQSPLGNCSCSHPACCLREQPSELAKAKMRCWNELSGGVHGSFWKKSCNS